MREELTKPKVIGLIRVSTKGQADDDKASFPAQRASILRTVEHNNLDCIDIVEVSDVSGTNVLNCPSILRILDQVSSRQIQGVVVTNQDRLFRPASFADYAILEYFKTADAKLYCGDSTIDFATQTGRMTAVLKGMFSGEEIITTKQRVADAKEEKRKEGKHPNSSITLPRGVAYDRKAGVFTYTDEVTPVAEAFRLVDEKTISNICEIGRQVGIHHRTLANLLRNPIYMGIRRYDTKRGAEKYFRSDGKQSDRKKISRKPSEVIEVKISNDPPVSPERFARVQSILSIKKRTWSEKRSLNPVVNLGTGVAKCGFCESPLYCSSGKRKNRKRIGYYQCKKNYYLFKKESGGCAMSNVRNDHLDKTIDNFVAAELTKHEVLTAIIKHTVMAKEDTEAKAFDPKMADRVVAEIDRKLAKAYKAYEGEGITLEQYKAKKQELVADRAKAILLKDSIVENSKSNDVPETIALIVKGAMAFSRIQSLEEKHQVIQQLFESISFKHAEIEAFKLMPQFHAGVPHTGTHTDKDSSRQQA